MNSADNTLERGILPPRFTQADAERAYDEWGANCGPGAIAAIMWMTLDELRPYMSAAGFDAKHYTNPTMMNDVLRAIGRPWYKMTAPTWPTYGLVRIQWEGPWTEPGANARWRYRFTHWVGAARRNGEIGIFDINCMNNGSGWVSKEDWAETIAPHLIALYPRANGKWHITHAIEVESPEARANRHCREVFAENVKYGGMP